MAKHIVVVGAGMAGLATAVALQRRGLDVTVFEERADMSNGAGISIWPNALAALGAIGLGDAVREAGGRVTVTVVPSSSDVSNPMLPFIVRTISRAE